MQTTAGIYKDNPTDIPDYVGCTEEVDVFENSRIYDAAVESLINSTTPDVLRSSAFDVFGKLLTSSASRVLINSNQITEAYNLDTLSEDMVYRLISFYDIEYPLNYEISWLELLVKTIEKIRKVRGTEKSIRMLLRVLERSEMDLYNDDSDDIEIHGTDGHYYIHCSRLRNKEFTEYMLRKVMRAGIGFTFDNTYRRNNYTVRCYTHIYSDYHGNGSSTDTPADRLDKVFVLDKGSSVDISYDY